MPRDPEVCPQLVEPCQRTADLAHVYVVHGPEETPCATQTRHLAEYPHYEEHIVCKINTGVPRAPSFGGR
jgi:hypothetical protein